MKMQRRFMVFCLVTTLVAPNCFGWGTVGHKTVGRIAAALLTPDAQKMVAAKLGVANTKSAVASAMADAAEWPDAIARTKYPNSADWHFIDLGVAPSNGDVAQWSSPTTAFAKLVAYYTSTTTGKPDELESGSDLKFIAHLVGDIHQPLHDTTDQDRGGNCVYVQLTLTGNTLSAKDKFHHELDDTLVEKGVGTSDVANAATLVSQWNALSPEAKKAMIGDPFAGEASTSFRAWILESHDLAVTKLYKALVPAVPSLPTAKVSGDCSDAAAFTKAASPYTLNQASTKADEELVKEQLMKAGVRLAAVLNQAANSAPVGNTKSTPKKSAPKKK